MKSDSSVGVCRRADRLRLVGHIFATALLSLLAVNSVAAQTLLGRAVLSADTFAAGPTSGQFIAAANGRVPPFPNAQPVQGFSAVLRAPAGDFYALSDNGYGGKANSPDYVLRVSRINPDFKTRAAGSGAVAVVSSIILSDPDRRVSFPIVADAENYPNSSVPVNPLIRSNRLLTGGDFDIESFRQTADGTFWFGDEFGPYLLHTDATGRVIDAPFQLPGVLSPDNTFIGGLLDPNLPGSRGFEGMALSSDGTKLYPMLEGALTTDPDQRRLIISEFDLAAKTFTGVRRFYRTEVAGHAIGDFTALSARRFLVIERDNLQGAAARFKKIYIVDFDRVNQDGFLIKTELVDLLNIADPDDIGGAGNGVFTFPFQTIESVIPLSVNTIGVLNDNNYPFSAGRTPGQPDDNEFIVIGFDRPLTTPIVIGHRGASGYRPEHTLAAYQLAVEMGADYIEPDIVSTRDGVLVARHENEIGGTTDVAARPEFADRFRTKSIDGVNFSGWFTEDFTLAELKTLRAKERIPQLRPQNTAYDGQFEVPTLQEVIDLAKQLSAETGRTIGIYPETKHPTYFDSIGLSMEEPLVAVLDANGYTGPESPVFVQSFEVGNLKDLRSRTGVPLVQLIDAAGRPYDFTAGGDARTYADLVSPAGLAEIATYAQGIGTNKNVLVPRSNSGALLTPTHVIADAHAVGLIVHGWTFRSENNFLPLDFRAGDPADPTFLRQYGNAAAEYELFFGLGLDGVFSDNPDNAFASRVTLP